MYIVKMFKYQEIFVIEKQNSDVTFKTNFNCECSEK